MSAGERTQPRSPDSGYATSSDLLPGAVVSTVGYSTPASDPPSDGSVSDSEPGTLHRGLPSPYLTFIFTLDGPIVTGVSPEHARSASADRNDVLVAGLHDRPTFVVQPPGQAGIQLSVHPLAARSLFGPPAAGVPWDVTEGVDLLGAEVDRVRDRLIDQASWPARFAILADYLHRRQKRLRCAAVRPEVAEAWSWLARSGGAGSMDALARHVALSSRQLRILFDRELGIGPKQVGRLMRFDTARQQVAAAVAGGGAVHLTELAHRCGYYDHPHLNSDFRQFTGLSPTRWIEDERRNIQDVRHRAAPG